MKGQNTLKWIDISFEKKVDQGLIDTSYVPSKEQLANVLTKALLAHQHNKILSKMGLFIPSHSHLERECKQ